MSLLSPLPMCAARSFVRRHTPFRIASSEPTRDPPSSALFLSETVEGLNDGANFLRNCPPADMALVRRNARSMVFKSGDPVFLQGHCHEGIYLIEVGIVRVYYTGPSGREITLAYWPPCHFIGGPKIFGGGTHIWSGEAVEDSRVLFLPPTVQALGTRLPSFASCLVEGLVANGRC